MDIKNLFEKWLDSLPESQRSTALDYIRNDYKTAFEEKMDNFATEARELLDCSELGANASESEKVVDSFLYPDQILDDLVDEGLFKRAVCKKCNSDKNVEMYEFVSHSFCNEEMAWIFENVPKKKLLDVGSRFGAVMYAAEQYGFEKVIGIEIDGNVGKIGKKLGVQGELVIGDIAKNLNLIEDADIIIFNNVFQYFMTDSREKIYWKMIFDKFNEGQTLVFVPSLEELDSRLSTSFNSAKNLTLLKSQLDYNIFIYKVERVQ